MKTSESIKALALDIKQVARGKSIFNEAQIQKLFNSTHYRYKYNRPARGGGKWTYVRASYMRRVLDSIFGFNWDFEIETGLQEAFEVAKATGTCVVKGVLTGKVFCDGQWIEIRKTQFGRAEVKMKRGTKEPLDFGNDMKAASSDALKKSASLIGIAGDVYDAEEFQEIHIIGADNEKQKKQLDKKIKEAKKQLKAPGEKVND